MARPGGANPGLVAKLEQERQLKAGITSHKTGLPKKLLELFEPLPPLPHKAVIRHRKPVPTYTGMAQFVEKFAEPGDPEYEPPMPEELPPTEKRKIRNPEYPAQARLEKLTKAERDDIKREKKQKEAAEELERRIKKWDPSKDPHVEGDPFKTLFVGRLSYDTTEKKLRREFEEYGPVKNITIVHSIKTGKPRGYAFIEYEHKNDMKNAYKMADGRKIEGKRVCVDVERGRTVPTWKPMRLGGGKGGESRLAKEPKNPTKRAAQGLPPLGPGGLPLRVAPLREEVRRPEAREERRPEPREERRPEPREERRPEPREERRPEPREERRPEPRRRDEPPSAAAQQWPVSSGAEDRDRERDRARDRDRERDRPAREARDRTDREYVEKARGERERERDRDRRSGRSRERDRDRVPERKRERDREAGELDGRDSRSSKRHRDEDRPRSSSRRRERDL